MHAYVFAACLAALGAAGAAALAVRRKPGMAAEALEAMEDGFVAFRADETVRYYNGAAKRFFPELEKGRLFFEPGRLARLEGPETVVQRRPDRTLRVRIEPVYGRKRVRDGYRGWICDDTAAERQERMIGDLKEQAENASQAKSQFLANMSHEIRTPMNAILGLAQIILRDQALGEESRSNVVNIQNAGNILISILNDILDFSKMESGRMEITPSRYQIGNILRDIDNTIGVRLAEKNVAFIIKADPALPSALFGDELRLRQILNNLLDNAVKYTDAGKIMLKAGVRREPGADGKDGRGEGRERILLEFEVSDTGIGIREEALPLIFRNFERMEKEENRFIKGTGLGLSIVKRLLELMGGEISVKSIYGIGTTFTVLLPQWIEDEKELGAFVQGEAGAAATPPAGSFLAPGARILAVDDNDVNLKVLSGLLTPYQMRVDTAASGLECLELLKEREYDLILLDHMMPEMDGIETLCRIRDLEKEQGRQEAPVIAFTANAVAGSREMFLREGFQGYVAKPVELKLLEKALRENLPEHLLQEAERPAGQPKEKPAPAFQVSIEGIDYERGLSLFAGDREQYLEIVESVRDEGRRLAVEMSEALAAEKYQDYTIKIHALKGMTANIGADGFAQKAKALELAGKEGDYGYIRRFHEEAMEEFEAMAEGMDRLILSEGKEEEGAGENLPEISGEELCGKIKEAKKYLEDYYRDEALEVLKECLSFRLPDGVRKGLKEMNDMACQFQYQEPVEKAGEILAFLEKLPNMQ